MTTNIIRRYCRAWSFDSSNSKEHEPRQQVLKSFPSPVTIHSSHIRNPHSPRKDEIGSQGNSKKVCSLDELDPEIQAIVLLSDAYGAEGELGIVLSEKFVEHDAYCMFDALMIGARGSVAKADFFASSPAAESQSGLPPVIEASAALYYLLSIVGSSLHTHLVELGVEPQYFALPWLRSINLKKLLEKAKSLQILALVSNKASLSSAFGGAYNCTKSQMNSPNVPSVLVSPKTALSPLPDSYWEEKWRVLHKAEELRQSILRVGTLKNLGQAMLDHIQVLESVFQQDQGQVGS
ncbi:hypothetical protein V6N13_142489 [Hibiscus sabdariffa]